MSRFSLYIAKIIVYGLFCTLGVSTINAQNNTLKSLLSLPIEELMRVKITGSTLTPRDIKSVPSAVTVFTQKDLEVLGIDYLDELMNLVPGFQSYRSSATPMHTPYSSRGRRIGNPSAEILILIDGQRLEEPRTSGAGMILPKIKIKQIKQVEFIRGPGSAIYGSNAMMGVINITTISGENSIEVGYGSYNRVTADLQLSQTSNDFKFDILGYVERDSGDEYIVEDSFTKKMINVKDPRVLYNINSKVQWENTSFYFKYYQSQSDSFYVSHHISDENFSFYSSLLSLVLNQKFNISSINSHISVSYSNSSFRTHLQQTPYNFFINLSSPQSNEPLIGEVNYNNYSETRALWHNDWQIGTNGSMQFGVEFRYLNMPDGILKSNYDYGDFLDYISTGALPIRYYGELTTNESLQKASERNILGVYAQYLRTLFDKTHITLGLSYDSFSEIGSQLNPRVAIIQELGKNHSLKFLYGKAFRAPAENELNLENNAIILGNTQLKPESVQSLEFIWVGQWSEILVSAGYYENHFKDEIVQTYLPSGKFRYTNVTGDDHTRGIEFEISYTPIREIMIRGTYTYSIQKPDFAFREADNLASLMINYQLENWNFNLTSTFTGEREMAVNRDENNRIKLDNYILVFPKVKYRFSNSWSAYIQGKNLLNKEYFTPPLNAIISAGIPNRGIEVLGGIKYQF